MVNKENEKEEPKFSMSVDGRDVVGEATADWLLEQIPKDLAGGAKKLHSMKNKYYFWNIGSFAIPVIAGLVAYFNPANMISIFIAGLAAYLVSSGRARTIMIDARTTLARLKALEILYEQVKSYHERSMERAPIEPDEINNS
jgi:hypothetical protein